MENEWRTNTYLDSAIVSSTIESIYRNILSHWHIGWLPGHVPLFVTVDFNPIITEAHKICAK